MKRPHLLNVFNYKLFNCKNKRYLSYVNKIISTSAFKLQLQKDNVDIEYLDTVKSSQFYNEIFIIQECGSIKFLHYQNLILEEKLYVKRQLVF